MLLTDPDFVRRLEALYLLARKVLGGSLQADRKSTRKGSGITFADHAEYALGDDYRSIDWRVYARLETLMIKLFEIEEDTTVHIILDCSRSMESKFLHARQIAASLAYIALSSMDRVVIHSMGQTLETILPHTHGRGKLMTMLQAMQDTPCSGNDSRFSELTRELLVRYRRRGMVIVVSDFLFAEGYETGLQRLQWFGHEVYGLQVLDDQDTRCTLRGDMDLTCVETGNARRVTITATEAAAFEKAMANWNESLKSQCAKMGIGLTQTTTDVPFDQVIQAILHRGGLVA